MVSTMVELPCKRLDDRIDSQNLIRLSDIYYLCARSILLALGLAAHGPTEGLICAYFEITTAGWKFIQLKGRLSAQQ